MSREIKFRAWDKRKERFEDDKNIFVNQLGGIFSDEECEWFNDEYEIQMFTGLHDRNGTEIYDGDILDCGDRVVKVKWNEYHGQWDCDFVRYKGILSSNGITPVEWKYRADVYGNIYENPELLEAR